MAPDNLPAHLRSDLDRFRCRTGADLVQIKGHILGYYFCHGDRPGRRRWNIFACSDNGAHQHNQNDQAKNAKNDVELAFTANPLLEITDKFSRDHIYPSQRRHFRPLSFNSRRLPFRLWLA